MANSIAKLAIMLTTDTAGLTKGFQQATGQIQSFGSQVAALAGQMGLIGGGIGAAASVGWGVKLAAEAQTAQVAFEVMLGSGEKAAAMLANIKQFANTTPFGAADLRDAAKTMLAFGISADTIMPNLRMLGDVAGGDAQKLSSLALVLGQVASAGKLTGGDLLQLVNVGFNPLQIEAAGSAEKYKLLRKEMEAGNYTFDRVIAQFQKATSAGGPFSGMMERMSETLGGRWSTFQDQIAELAVGVGEWLVPALGKLLDVGTVLLGWVSSIDKETIVWMGTLAAAVVIIPKIVTGVVAIAGAMRMLATSQAIVAALSGPGGWATLAASIVIATGAAAAIGNEFDKATSKMVAASDKAKEATKNIKEIGKATAETTTKDFEFAPAAKQFEDMAQKGREFAKEFQSPAQKFVEYMQEAFQLYEAGAISAQTYAMAQEKAREEMEAQADAAQRVRDIQTPANNMADRYSVAGVSAAMLIDRNQRDRDENAKRQIEIAEQSKAELTKLVRIAERGAPIKVTEVQL